MPPPLPETTVEDLKQFLPQSGIPADVPLEVVSHHSGQSVLHVHHEGLDYTLKCFDRSAPHLAAAFHHEHSFYVYLNSLQTGHTAILLGSDEDQQILLLSRLTGRPLRAEEVNRSAVKSAARFLVALNRKRDSQPAQACPPAPDSCRSVAEHLAAISNQVTAVQQYQATVNPQTQALIEDELNPIWEKTLRETLSRFETSGIAVDTQLNEASQILSPGEFGFHHAILTPEKDLCYVDYDQSGWDDPARVLNHFFTHGPISPKDDHWDAMIEPFLEIPGLDPHCAIRARLLLPAYQIAQASDLLLSSLTEHARPLSEDEGHTHSKTKLIGKSHEARRWLMKAGRAF